MRPAFVDSMNTCCQFCGGAGVLKSGEAVAISALREVHARASLGTAKTIQCKLPVDSANYLINSKRDDIIRLEKVFGIKVQVTGDVKLLPGQFSVETDAPKEPKKEIPREPHRKEAHKEPRKENNRGQRREPKNVPAPEPVPAVEVTEAAPDRDIPHDVVAGAVVGETQQEGLEAVVASPQDLERKKKSQRNRQRNRRRRKRGGQGAAAAAAGATDAPQAEGQEGQGEAVPAAPDNGDHRDNPAPAEERNEDREIPASDE